MAHGRRRPRLVRESCPGIRPSPRDISRCASVDRPTRPGSVFAARCLLYACRPRLVNGYLTQMAPGDTTVDTGGEFHLPPCLGVVRRSRADREAPETPHRTALAHEYPHVTPAHSPPSRSPKRPSASPTPPSPRGPSASASPMNSVRLYRDDQFAELFPTRGQPAASPARLAMASVLQYVEGLSDRQAADAVRGRIDWKYALGLELTDPGFDHTVLSEFRSRLVHGQAELQLLDTLLERCRELELIRRAGPAAHRLDSCPGRRPRAQSARAGRRDDAGRLERPGRDGARLAAGAGPCGVVPALWPARRELPPAQDRCGPRGAGPGHRGRWRATPGRRRCGDRSARAGAAPGGGDLAPRLGRAVHGRRRASCAGARSRTCPRRPD